MWQMSKEVWGRVGRGDDSAVKNKTKQIKINKRS